MALVKGNILSDMNDTIVEITRYAMYKDSLIAERVYSIRYTGCDKMSS